MRELIPESWRPQLGSLGAWQMLDEIEVFIGAQRLEHPGKIYPPSSDVFRALELTPLNEVRAVILGMDPYARQGQAHGLAFSLGPGARPFPSSLRNILNEVERDVRKPINRDGNLTALASRGVLLLNSALTVRDRTSGSHLGVWEPFTDAVIEAVNRRNQSVVFMLWGEAAKAKRRLIDADRHVIRTRSHPSWFSARINFTNTSPFREANDSLEAAGQPGIDWVLPFDPLSGDSGGIAPEASPEPPRKPAETGISETRHSLGTSQSTTPAWKPEDLTRPRRQIYRRRL